MDRAIIIGAYENWGFRFCSSLLEEGFEVTGIQIRKMGKEDLEKKQMEIGRNANFQEVFHKDWLPFAEVHAQTLIIIDFHYFRLCSSSHSLDISASLENFLLHNKNKIEDTHSKVICLLPIEGDESTNKHFHHMIQSVKASDYYYLYLSRDADIQNKFIKHLIEGGF